MKCHIGVDAGTGYVHSVTATSANAMILQKLIICCDKTMRLCTEIRGSCTGFVSALDSEQGVAQISVLSEIGVMYVVDEEQIEAIKEV